MPESPVIRLHKNKTQRRDQNGKYACIDLREESSADLYIHEYACQNTQDDADGYPARSDPVQKIIQAVPDLRSRSRERRSAPDRQYRKQDHQCCCDQRCCQPGITDCLPFIPAILFLTVWLQLCLCAVQKMPSFCVFPCVRRIYCWSAPGTPFFIC